MAEAIALLHFLLKAGSSDKEMPINGVIASLLLEGLSDLSAKISRTSAV